MSDKERQDLEATPDTGASTGTKAGKAAAEAAAKEDMAGEASEIEALRLENVDLRNRLLREMAEMENLRKRTVREKADASRFAIAKFARDLLTVGDDLRRAIDAAPAEARANADDPVATLLSGVEATERQFLQILDRHGVRRFEPLGEKFDPANHEALFEVPDPAKPSGTISQVVEAGYMIGERVLRPARVGVAKGGPRIAPQSAEPEPVAGTGPAAEAGPQSSPQPPVQAPREAAGPETGENDDGDGGVGGRIDRTA